MSPGLKFSIRMSAPSSIFRRSPWPSGLRRIDRHRAFVAVDADEIAGVIPWNGGAPVTDLVTLGRLDFDDVSAMGSDRSSCSTGPAEHAGQVETFNPDSAPGDFASPLPVASGLIDPSMTAVLPLKRMPRVALSRGL